MTTVALCPIYNGQQFFDSQGRVLSGGKIYTYQAGTTTPQATYTTSAGSVQNANPIILNSAGRSATQIWFISGDTYKLVLTDSTGNTLDTQDNLSGLNDQPLQAINEWATVSAAPTYFSTNSFTTPGDTTGTYTVGRRVRAHISAGTIIYGSVYSSTYSGGTLTTTIVLTMDSTNLDSGLSAADVGILNPINSSIPTVAFSAQRSAAQNSGTTIIFDTIEKAVSSGYDNTSGVFTAPITGWYYFSSTLLISNTTGGAVFNGFNIKTNASQVVIAETLGYQTNNQSLWLTAVGTIFLTSGQTAWVAPVTISATQPVIGGQGNRFSGFLL